YSACGGIVTSREPENFRAVSLPATILLEFGATGRAISTAVKCSGVLPKRFERRTRTSLPPSDKCRIWRSVASRRSSGLSALYGSTSCCDAAHEPTHRLWVVFP